MIGRNTNAEALQYIVNGLLIQLLTNCLTSGNSAVVVMDYHLPLVMLHVIGIIDNPSDRIDTIIVESKSVLRLTIITV